MSGKHLGKGSAQPILPDDGVMRLYSMRFCPYAQRVHLVLNAKNLKYHTIYINLTEKPEWLVNVSALLKVPALHLVDEKEQPSLIESLIIAEYLDDKYPQNPLLPKDPLKRAQEKILLEHFNAVTKAFMSILLKNTGFNDLWTGLEVFELELTKRGTSYFGGEKPGYVDYMIWPWFERLAILKYVLKDEFKFDEKRFVNFAKWLELMKKDSVVQSFVATDEQHVEYWRSRVAGNTNYDQLANL